MALREILARFGIQVDAKQLAAANTGIISTLGSLKVFGAFIAGSFLIRGITNFVGDIVSAGDELGKTAKQLGIGVTSLQRWQVAAQLSGASTKEFNTGMRTLAKNVLLADQGSKQAADGFKLLNIEVKDNNGNLKDSETIFRETGLALGKLENNTERVALAQQLLGRSGVKLLPLFSRGAEELDKLLGKLEEYGGGIGPEAVRLSEEAADQFLLFGVATDSLKSKLAVALLPIISQVVGALSRFITATGKLFENTNILKSAFVALGLALAQSIGFASIGGLFGALGSSLLKLAKVILIPLAKFVLLALVVDDFITLLQGGDSLIGRLLDRIFGKGSAKALVQAIKDVGSAFSDLFASGDFAQFDKDLEAIFGPPGQALIEGTIEMFDAMALAIGEFIVEGAIAIDTWLRESMASIRGAITGFVSATLALGEAIVDGIIEGIKEGAGAVVDAVVDMANAAVDAAKNIFKPGSPSRVFFEMGMQNVQGLVAGTVAAARALSGAGAQAVASASGLSTASASTSARGGGGRISRGGLLFKTEISIPITGGAPNDQQISKLRQGLRKALDDNRRATIAALTQLAEPVPV